MVQGRLGRAVRGEPCRSPVTAARRDEHHAAAGRERALAAQEGAGEEEGRVEVDGEGGALLVRPAARGDSYLLARLGRCPLVAAVEESDVSARVGQGLGDCPPDIAGAARDERCLARKIDGIHVDSIPNPEPG